MRNLAIKLAILNVLVNADRAADLTILDSLLTKERERERESMCVCVCV